MAWTRLKKLAPSPQAHSSAGGGAAAQKTRWGQSSQEKANALSLGKNSSRRARFWISLLAVPTIGMAGMGMAHADTDILINQEACAIGAGGANTANCPNSLDGPAGGNVRFTAKVIWNTGGDPGVVTLVDRLPIGAIFRSLDGATCSDAPAAGATIASNQTLTCTLPPFAGTGDTNAQRVNFVVTLPTVSTAWKNYAEVSATATETGAALDNNELERG